MLRPRLPIADDIYNWFTFWKPDTYNKQEYQTKYLNNQVKILKR